VGNLFFFDFTSNKITTIVTADNNATETQELKETITVVGSEVGSLSSVLTF
jgi:hypothetical protein